MKKMVAAVTILLMVSTLAFAEWLMDFQNIFVKEGIDNAVEAAMKEGIGPDLIVENGLLLEGLNPANLVKALYCAGAQGKDIEAAAEKYQISEVVVIAGYRQSLAECGNAVVDAQPFTPVATGTSFVSVTPGGGGNVSPSVF